MHRFLIGILLALGLAVLCVSAALASPAPSPRAFAPHSLEWDAFYFDRYEGTASVKPQRSDPARELLRGCHAKDSNEHDESGDL